MACGPLFVWCPPIEITGCFTHRNNFWQCDAASVNWSAVTPTASLFVFSKSHPISIWYQLLSLCSRCTHKHQPNTAIPAFIALLLLAGRAVSYVDLGATDYEGWLRTKKPRKKSWDPCHMWCVLKESDLYVYAGRTVSMTLCSSSSNVWYTLDPVRFGSQLIDISSVWLADDLRPLVTG